MASKKGIATAFFLTALIFLSGCGVSKDKYNTLLNDKIALEEKVEVLTKAREALKNEYDNLLKEKMELSTRLETVSNEKNALKGEYDKLLDEKITVKASYDKLMVESKDLRTKLEAQPVLKKE